MRALAISVGGNKPVTKGSFPAPTVEGLYHFRVTTPVEENAKTWAGGSTGRVDLKITLDVDQENDDGTIDTFKFIERAYVVEDYDAFAAFKAAENARTGQSKTVEAADKFFKDVIVRIFVAGNQLPEGEQAEGTELELTDDAFMALEGELYFWPAGTEGIGHDGGPSRFGAHYLLTPSEVDMVNAGEWTPPKSAVKELPPRENAGQGQGNTQVGGGTQVTGGAPRVQGAAPITRAAQAAAAAKQPAAAPTPAPKVAAPQVRRPGQAAPATPPAAETAQAAAPQVRRPGQRPNVGAATK